MKVRLKIKYLDENINEIFLDGIKEKNKYIYIHDNNIITIDKMNKIIKIKNKDSFNTIFLKEAYGMFEFEKRFVKYNIDIIELIILDKYIELTYKIDSERKFILEEIC